MNEPNQTPAPGGNKLMTIFLAVLGLHVVVIVAVSAYYFLKGKSDPVMAETTPAAEMAPADPLLATTGTPAGTEATLDTENAPIISQDMLQSMDASASANPMPATTDPIWQDGVAPASNTSLEASAPVVAKHDTAVAPVNTAAPATNDFGAVPVAESAAPAPLSPEVTYSVVTGDSLYKIAKKHGVSVSQIKQANGLTTDALKIGQKLTIPGGKSVSVAKSTPAKAAAPVKSVAKTSSGSTTYQVAKGDTLWKIAHKFGTEPKAIAEVNGITDPSKLKVGSSIKIPVARAEAKPATTTTSQVRQAEAPKAKPVSNTDMAMLNQ